MNRLTFLTLTAPLLVAVAILSNACSSTGHRLYVSPKGDDRAAGTQQSPFRTLQHAQEAARGLAKEMRGDVVVSLAPGDYRLEKTLAFTEADSGRNGFRVIYRSADGPGKARLLGSVPLKGWKLWRDGIWKIELPPKTVFHTLYENGKRVHKARFPDLEYDPEFPTALGRYLVTVGGTPVQGAKDLGKTKEPGWLTYRPEDAPPVTTITKMRIHIYGGGKRDWVREVRPVASIDPKARRLDIKGTVFGGVGAGARFFLEDELGFLNAPGEFFVDEPTHTLYYMPVGKGHPDTLGISYPVLNRVIQLQGKSREQCVENLVLDGLALGETDNSPPLALWADAGHRDGALIWLNNTAHIEVRNCHLKNSGRTGIMMIGQNTGNLVAGCWIEHMGLNGVSLCNRFSATRDRCEHNRIHNTRISHVGELHCYAECVTVFNVSSNEVDHCELNNSVRYAITVRGNTGAQYGPPVTTSLPPAKGNRFHHIRVSRCGQDSGDMGALHTAGLNNPGGGSVNTFEQIVVTDTRAIASMKDHPPDGIFIDWPKMSMDQVFRDIQILRPQAKQLRSNGKDNETSAQTENVSWKPDFREDRMDYKNIGLTAEFPAEYGLRSRTVSDMALRWQCPVGGPRHSDVCFSIRWMRKNVDPFEKIAAFHGTRFDWVYATKEFIGQCAQRGYPICHCTAPMRQDSGPGEGSANATYKIGRAEGSRGQPLIASWQNWSPPWGCYSNPDFFRLMEQDVMFAVESGATYMHVDDPDTRQMLKWGGDAQEPETRGCFCGYCLKNFRAHLATLPAEELKALGIGDPAAFDYKQFILDGKRSAPLRKHYERCYEKTIRAFLEKLRASAHKKAGRYFPFACNNGSFTHWEPPIDLFDFAVGELSKYDPPTPVSLWKKALKITRMNKAQVFTLRSKDTQENQKILCLSYCLGMNFVAPWDVWLGGSERLYGEPQDYNHFFAFVRDNARWLDGYEYAAATGKGIRDEWYGDQSPATAVGNEDAYVFVRAMPGASDKPVVVHLYDWGKTAKPFRVVLNNKGFFSGKRLACRLLTPVKQSAEENARAEKTKDFSKFTRSAELPCGGDDRQTELEIPALNPWAMLIVSPAK